MKANKDSLPSLVAAFHGVTLEALLGRGKKRPLPDARLQTIALLYAAGFQEYSIAGQLGISYAWAYQCRQRFLDRMRYDKQFYAKTEQLWLYVLDRTTFKLNTAKIERQPYEKQL